MEKKNFYLSEPTRKLDLLRQEKTEMNSESKLQKDIDPSAQRKQQKELLQKKQESSFETVAREWLAKQSQTWAKSHLSRNTSRLERDIFPKLGKRAVDEITPQEILKALRKIEERGAVESAHRTLSLCSQIFRYAVQTARRRKTRPVSCGCISNCGEKAFICPHLT